MSETTTAAEVAAPHRYTAALAADIEARWQAYWEEHGTYEAPNPSGELAGDAEVVGRPKRFIMDMFPYPSGAGLHVGHPLGFIATDVYARHQRMTGHNSCTPWASTPSGCPLSSTRCRPAPTRGSPPRPTS